MTVNPFFIVSEVNQKSRYSRNTTFGIPCEPSLESFVLLLIYTELILKTV